MTTYRTTIVGGRRGIHHARAYQDIENMKVVAICEIDEDLRKTAVEELNVTGYAAYEEMLEKEKPDIVHAVTNPTIPRHIWVEPAAMYRSQQSGRPLRAGKRINSRSRTVLKI